MTQAPRDPWKILVVDDDQGVHDVTELTLKRLVYEDRPLVFLHAFSAREAREMLSCNSGVAVALIDVVMEDDAAGLNLVKYIRGELGDQNIRLVLRTGNPGLAPEESVTMNYDINDYRGKSELSAQSLRTVIITALRSFSAINTIHNLNKEIDETQKEIIYALSEIAESRSTSTSHHVQRVGKIAAFLAEKLGYSGAELKQIELAASMHDIGKMAIHDTILNKPGALVFEEFEVMKKHCEYGFEILCKSQREFLKKAARIALEHHENFDGSGYPRKLNGDQIDLLSRVVALADVFDALSTKRIYKEPWPADRILEYVRQQRGRKFDPRVVDIFLEHYDDILELIAN